MKTYESEFRRLTGLTMTLPLIETLPSISINERPARECNSPLNCDVFLTITSPFILNEAFTNRCDSGDRHRC
jgi:hypothetical protein